METYIGQICLFGFNYAPQGWAQCNGQILSINQYTALFALLGTQFGGNGTTTFGLPDLRGRVPLGMGQGPGLSNYTIGQAAGNETVTLNTSQMPAHTHMLTGSSNAATASTLQGNVLSSSNGATSGEEPVTVNAYGPVGNPVTADPSAIGLSGNGQPLPIMQPYLGMNYCIALQGIFPPRQ